MRKGKRAAIIGGVILLLGAVAFGWYWYQKPRTGVTGKKADVTLGAEQLYQQFNADEVAANEKFLNKIIQVEGTIASIQQTGESQVVLLGTSAPMAGVSCRMSGKDNGNNARLEEGKQVIIKGRCTGFLMDVNLADCVLVKP